MKPIGVIRSPYGQKFGVPRQAGLVPAAIAVLEVHIAREAVRGLEQFSHLWVIFAFDRAGAEKIVVRPPRLGGSRRIGVLASRAPHRPNRIGMSAVRLLRVEPDAPGCARVVVAGGDFLDRTPLLDVKPYVPYADCIPEATSGWAEDPIPRQAVAWAPEAEAWRADESALASVVEASLALNPRRPRARDGSYVMRVSAFDVVCAVNNGSWLVTGVRKV